MHDITPGERKLQDLPNMPDNLPDSYFKLLKELLEYKHKKRKAASQILESSDFVRFHTFASAVDKKSNIIGSVGRHSLFLDYQKFERSLTTLLATMLSKTELLGFVNTVQSEAQQQQLEKKPEIPLEIPTKTGDDSTNGQEEETKEEATEDNSKSLDIVTVVRVMEILKESGNDQVISMIEKLPGSGLYDSFAYDITVLKYFVREGSGKRKSKTAKRRASGSGRPLFGKIRQGIDSSLHSFSGRIRASLDFSGHSSISGRMRPSSMDGSNHSFNTKKTTKIAQDGTTNSRRTSNFL